MARPNPAPPRRTDPAPPTPPAAPATPAAPAEPVSYFTHVKLWVTGLLGVLVVLPSLINAGLDVYSSLLKLPKTEAERINEKLFREYFGKQPVATVPVPIKQNNGIVEVRFAIYDKGDVFVEFGNFSQWFPFPAGQGEAKKPMAFSLISSAHAQAPASTPASTPTPPPQGVGQFQQTDRMERGALVREKIYENGVVENQVIDTRSGDILDSSIRQTNQTPPALPASSAVLVVPQVAPIDLDQHRKTQQIKAAGAVPTKDPTAVWQEGLKAELAWCEQKDWALSRYICTYQTTHKWCDPADGWGKVKECVK